MTEFLLLFLLISILTNIPVIGPYIGLFNTMVHESGHAFVAYVTGGRVRSISLFANTEGLAVFEYRHWFGRVLTILAGYPISSFVSVIFIYGIKMEYYLYLGLALFGLLLYNLVFWVRNFVGWIWVLTVLLGLTFMYYFEYVEAWKMVLNIIGISLLIQAFISSWTIFVMSLKDKGRAGDAAFLAEATYVPAVIWGLLFLVQGTIFFIVGIMIWFGYDIMTIFKGN
ncbi:M50 family metallopeptidase [Evansella sp. AB-rgal1]|uniref:M50 family metallopeptidase n=1 Tax=Evansella sp. AB-rgal1 TaxID=3242696 RepID=UPI00359ED90D